MLSLCQSSIPPTGVSFIGTEVIVTFERVGVHVYNTDGANLANSWAVQPKHSLQCPATRSSLSKNFLCCRNPMTLLSWKEENTSLALSQSLDLCLPVRFILTEISTPNITLVYENGCVGIISPGMEELARTKDDNTNPRNVLSAHLFLGDKDDLVLGVFCECPTTLVVDLYQISTDNEGDDSQKLVQYLGTHVLGEPKTRRILCSVVHKKHLSVYWSDNQWDVFSFDHGFSEKPVLMYTKLLKLDETRGIACAISRGRLYLAGYLNSELILAVWNLEYGILEGIVRRAESAGQKKCGDVLALMCGDDTSSQIVVVCELSIWMAAAEQQESTAASVIFSPVRGAEKLLLAEEKCSSWGEKVGSVASLSTKVLLPKHLADEHINNELQPPSKPSHNLLGADSTVSSSSNTIQLPSDVAVEPLILDFFHSASTQSQSENDVLEALLSLPIKLKKSKLEFQEKLSAFLKSIRDPPPSSSSTRYPRKRKRHQQTILSQMFVDTITKYCLKHHLWDSLTHLLRTGRVTATGSPNLVPKLISKKKHKLLRLCVLYICDLKESDFVNILQSLLQKPNITKKILKSDSAVWKLMYEIFCCPRNDVFIEEALRSLEIEQTISLISILCRCMEAKWELHQDHRNSPPLRQVVDWLCFVVDTHFTELILIQDCRETVLRLKEMSQRQLRQCDLWEKTRPSFDWRALKRMKRLNEQQERNAPYVIEKIKF